MRSPRLVAVLIAAALLAAACSSSGSDSAVTADDATSTSTTSTSTTSTTAAPPTSPPTTAPATITTTTAAPCPPPDSGDHAIEINGTDRRYVVFSPAATAEPAPLLVLFHGFSSTAELGALYTELSRLAPEAGVVLAAPQALGDPSAWRILDPAGADGDFIDAMIAELTASDCVDESRVWLAGFSAGSAMAALYGCLRDTPIAGMFLASGLAPAICAPDATPDVLIHHGTGDPVVPFGGGDQAIGDSSVNLGSIPDSAAGWAERAGCSTEPEDREVGDDVVVRTWSGCIGGTEVQLTIVDDGGHTWPGAPVDRPIAGKTTQTFHASCVLLHAINDADGDAYDLCPGRTG